MIRDQRALAGELVGLLQDVALTLREDRDIPCPPTLGPGRLQREVIAAVRVARLELNGLFASQAVGRLEHEAHTDIVIVFSAKRIVWQRPALGDIADMDTPREPIVIIATRHDAPLPDPLGPPAQSTQAVVEGPGREAFLLPTLDQRHGVLQLPGRELQHPQAIRLRRITAVGVVAAQQFELIVQVVHRELTPCDRCRSYGECYRPPVGMKHGWSLTLTV